MTGLKITKTYIKAGIYQLDKKDSTKEETEMMMQEKFKEGIDTNEWFLFFEDAEGEIWVNKNTYESISVTADKKTDC